MHITQSKRGYHQSTMATAYVKIEIGADIRRVSLKKDLDLPSFKQNVWALFDVKPADASVETMVVKYRDSDGDLVTLGSTSELQVFVDEVFAKKDAPQRLVVS